MSATAEPLKEETGEQEKQNDDLNKSSDLKSKSKTKHVNKLLYKQIREQMEFYFSDSNLSKDRFIKQEISKSSDGFIDLSSFLKFNKIRALTTDLSTIVKSLKRSTILELNEDHTKIKRCVPFVEPSQADIDKRTVYVERLPPHVTHDLLKSIFSRCGNVSYISLPKFKTTKQIKGFAFIEFENKEGAKNAIKMLNDQVTEDDDTVGKFPKYNKQLVDLEEKLSKTIGQVDENVNQVDNFNKSSFEDNENPVVVVEETKNEVVKSKKKENKKRKLAKANDSVESTNNEPVNKERKVEDGNENKEKAEDKQDNDTEMAGDDAANVKKKKNRRRKHSVIKAKKIKKEIAEEATLLHLRVISKKEWLKLKEEYLTKQKQNLSELKAKLKSLKEQEAVEMSEKANKKKDKKRQKNESDDSKRADDSVKMEIAVPPSDVENGSVIKLIPKSTSDDKSYELFKLTRQQFKNEKLKDYIDDIAYVDLDKNTNKIFIRCKNKQSAENLLKKSNEYLSDFNKNLLSGNEESEYFNKISMNRNRKQEKKEKKQVRGKNKIINKANKVIKNEISANQGLVSDGPKAKTISDSDSKNVQTKTHIKFDED